MMVNAMFVNNNNQIIKIVLVIKTHKNVIFVIKGIIYLNKNYAYTIMKFKLKNVI